jgi:hypothetical protein
MLDNDISPRFAEMLQALGVNVIALSKAMPRDTKDQDFLGVLRSKYDVDVFISNNTAQRTNQVEAKLLRASGVTALYFMPFWSSMKFWPQAEWLVKHWPAIDAFCRVATQGTCADIQQRGRLRTYNF